MLSTDRPTGPAATSHGGSRTLARVTAPLARPLAGRRIFPLWGVIHHVGRSSGRAYALPVVVRELDGTLVVPLPWGERTQWVRNVLAAGGALVRWRGRDVQVTAPRTVPIESVLPAFSRWQRGGIGSSGIREALVATIEPEPEPERDAARASAAR
jgi:deazaflavin-dependent oxidoreductase (nitroreductase family)